MTHTDPKVYEHISQKTNDPILERKTCRVSGTQFPLFQSDKDFYEKISPVIAGKRYLIPSPTLCPEERQRRRMSFRNERKLYRRKCDATGETIISNYAPNSSSTVYGYTFRLGDDRNPSSYGKDFDFNTPGFFSQFAGLTQQVPSKSLVSEYNENCDYTSICGYCKDCYMTTASEYSQQCMYGYLLQTCEDVIDSSCIFNSKVCYQCIDCNNCYHCFWSKELQDCNYCYGCEQLQNCSHCIDCSGLSQKQYCINNKQVTKQEFEDHLSQYSPKGYTTFEQLITPALNVHGSENAFGGSIGSSKNIHLSFEVEKSQDISYSQVIVDCDTLMDCSNCYVTGSKSYEVMSSLHTYNNLFCGFVYNCSDCFYSLNCSDSKHLFGCANITNGEYCIFNKQYTKDEYKKLVPRIIEHMQASGERGEFFDSSLSPFGYNETVAHEYFPLERTEALAKGYKRQDENYDPHIPSEIQTLSGDDIPVDTTKVSDDILKKILICETSGRPYRIIRQELDFYRKYGLALPRKHPDVRHQERFERRPGRKLFLRKCDVTDEILLSVYPEGSSAKVYGDEAYQQHMLG